MLHNGGRDQLAITYDLVIFKVVLRPGCRVEMTFSQITTQLVEKGIDLAENNMSGIREEIIKDVKMVLPYFFKGVNHGHRIIGHVMIQYLLQAVCCLSHC